MTFCLFKPRILKNLAVEEFPDPLSNNLIILYHEIYPCSNSARNLNQININTIMLLH